MGRSVGVRLPWPPSVNHYWRSRGTQRYVSPQVRAWQREAVAEIRRQVGRPRTITTEVAVTLVASPPDRRRRDLDNLLKAILDILVLARLIEDDHQVAELHALRREPAGRTRAHVYVQVDVL